mmetsp:Transcript_1531/g.3094  ORF Transcript_1531/g.3094 Transcript_1531/m.3094 type:complete len:267 (+) Transcript_1531:460-1260(+)
MEYTTSRLGPTCPKDNRCCLTGADLGHRDTEGERAGPTQRPRREDIRLVRRALRRPHRAEDDSQRWRHRGLSGEGAADAGHLEHTAGEGGGRDMGVHRVGGGGGQAAGGGVKHLHGAGLRHPLRVRAVLGGAPRDPRGRARHGAGVPARNRPGVRVGGGAPGRGGGHTSEGGHGRQRLRARRRHGPDESAGAGGGVPGCGGQVGPHGGAAVGRVPGLAFGGGPPHHLHAVAGAAGRCERVTGRAAGGEGGRLYSSRGRPLSEAFHK